MRVMFVLGPSDGRARNMDLPLPHEIEWVGHRNPTVAGGDSKILDKIAYDKVRYTLRIIGVGYRTLQFYSPEILSTTNAIVHLLDRRREREQKSKPQGTLRTFGVGSRLFQFHAPKNMSTAEAVARIIKNHTAEEWEQ